MITALLNRADESIESALGYTGASQPDEACPIWAFDDGDVEDDDFLDDEEDDDFDDDDEDDDIFDDDEDDDDDLLDDDE